MGYAKTLAMEGARSVVETLHPLSRVPLPAAGTCAGYRSLFPPLWARLVVVWTGRLSGPFKSELEVSMNRTALVLILLSVVGCGDGPAEPKDGSDEPGAPTPRLALWLAKKSELMAHDQARFDLVMTGWFEQAEAQSIRTSTPTARLLAGLTHTWVLDDPGWQALLVTVANGGDPMVRCKSRTTCT